MQDRKKSESINNWLQVIIFLAVYLLSFITLGFLLPTAARGDLTNAIYLPITAASILSIALVLLFKSLIFKADTTPLGLWFDKQARKAISGACLGIFLITGGSIILYTGNWLQWMSSEASAYDIVLMSGLLLLSAFSEELVFRGFILGRLLNQTKPLIALLVSSIVFALFHINNPEVSLLATINIFLGGILLGITYCYNRNIWFGFALHYSWNLVQGPILGIPVSGLILPSIISTEIKGPELITGGQFGLEGSLIQGILMVICCVGLWLLNSAENKTMTTAKKI